LDVELLGRCSGLFNGRRVCLGQAFDLRHGVDRLLESFGLLLRSLRDVLDELVDLVRIRPDRRENEPAGDGKSAGNLRY